MYLHSRGLRFSRIIANRIMDSGEYSVSVRMFLFDGLCIIIFSSQSIYTSARVADLSFGWRARKIQNMEMLSFVRCSEYNREAHTVK
jgi:hypothetical protein